MKVNQVINLSKSATEILLTRNISVNEEYSSYPINDDRYISLSDEIACVCENILNDLEFGKGYSVVKISDEYLKETQDIKVAFWNLFTCFARPLPQFGNGDLLHEVKMSNKPPPPRCSYSMSNGVADIHTDGSYMYKQPPEFMALICLTQAESGGESILVDGRQILRQLKKEYPQSVMYLKQGFEFNTDGQQVDSISFTKPIIVENNSTLIFNYNRIHIESGHRATGLPLSMESIDSMNKLDLLLNRKKNQGIFRLARGEMLVINNHYMLHGRNSFRDIEIRDSKRFMVRLWGS